MKKKKVLSVNLINHIVNFQWFILSSLLYFLIIYIFLGVKMLYNFEVLYWLIIPLIVCLYLHTSYFLMNWNKKYIINHNSIIEVNKNDEYLSSDIDKIIVYKTNFNNVLRFPIFPFQHYKYCKVKLKNGKNIYLTSLLHPQIDDYLKENIKEVLFQLEEGLFSYFP